MASPADVPGAPAPPAVAIEITSTPVLSYALAHNRVPVVNRIVLRASGGAVRGAAVVVTVSDADGPIATGVERMVDLDEGTTTVLTDVGLVVDPDAMLQVEDERPGCLEVRLEKDGEVLAEAVQGVQVLAAHQWLASPLPLALELLAAHVQPNHPAVAELVAEAGGVLAERTGRGELPGYGEGAERVDAVVAAIAEALRRRGIRYSEPPASWTDRGQQVRTPGDVLGWRVATPLDTAAVLAAALERAGVRPLLWLAQGDSAHAFVGYWREARSAESTATTDVAPLVDLVDLGLIGLVETTLVTGRGERSGELHTADLHRPAHEGWLTGELDRLIGVADVRRARRDGILPLPARARDAAGVLHVVEYRAAEHGGLAPVVEGPPVSGRPGEPLRVQQWKNALLDLSLRNRLINYSERAGLGLTVPGEALPILENVVSDGTPLTLLPADTLSDVQRERGIGTAGDLFPEELRDGLLERRELHVDVADSGYLGKLRGLAYKARTLVEETGANNLYLALGSLRWELDGRPLRSPLLLVPVHLTGTAGRYSMALDETGGSTPNYCLLEKLRRVHGLVVPSLSEGVDLETALQAMGTAVAERGLPYRVEPTADLAILQFAKFRLWKDLDEHWADLAQNPLVHHLVHQPTAPFGVPAEHPAGPPDGHPDGHPAGLPGLDELAAELPLPADASQLRAVAEALAGRTFVLEGPPGTGKSQTIANLLARAVADGKRVLFVAEKRAALDVVARRLSAVGMAPFVLDLHDKGSKAAGVRQHLRAALDVAGGGSDSGLAADGEELRSARRALARYAGLLHAPNAAGLSLYSARAAQLAAGEEVPGLPVAESFVAGVPADLLGAVRRALALFPDIADLARPSPRHPWGFVDSPDLDLPATQAAAREVDEGLRALTGVEALAGPLRWAHTPEDLGALVHLLSGPPVGLDVLDETFTEWWTAATSAVIGEAAGFSTFRHPGLDVLAPSALQLPLAELYVRAQTAAAANWFVRRSRLNAVRAELLPHLKPGAVLRPKSVPAVVENLWRVQTAGAAIAAQAAAIPGIALPPEWNPFTDADHLRRQVGWLRAAATAVDGASPFHVALRRLIVARATPDPAAAAAVERLRAAVVRLLEACRSTSAALGAWAGDDGLALRWQMTRPERGVESSSLISLRRWVSLLDTLEPLRAAGLAEARRRLLRGEVRADDAVRAFDRGVAEASVAERAAATGLNAFHEGDHERAVRRFAAASRAVRRQLTAALPAAVAARHRTDGAAEGQLDALRRELAKQRRGLGVRALLARYGELVTAVTPCVLVSPDSVARFFPARAALFDLVVFDEASQIRVADAVGALGRARAAVVVGDSKQMPPTSFMEPSAGTDGLTDGADVADLALDDSATEDGESILSECVSAQVPRHWLSWHYRSQDETLIAFSNAQYYDNRLSSFPAPTHGRPSPDPDGRGVALVRVDGEFVRSGPARLLRTNPAEAEAIVAEIRRRFDTADLAAQPNRVGAGGEPRSVGPSIGVVTFNASQRSLIEGLLRDTGDERLVAALDRSDGEGLFVKNLENVQGDERDVVFFSTAFSPDSRGRLPLNFGPLNRAGGERRLNVAVTRARRQVVVFSSFDPEQLRAEETSSVGIKHLRAYLDVAAGGVDSLPRAPRSRHLDRHREEIAAALRARGLRVSSDVGLSDFRIDLSVCRPGDRSPRMAVLLDGPAWAARQTVADRDGLPIEVLGGLQRWPVVERVWLPSWLADPDAVVERLARVLDDDSEAPQTDPGSEVPLVRRVLADVELPSQRGRTEPFRGVAALRSGSSGVVAAPVPADREPMEPEPVDAEPVDAEPAETEPAETEPADAEPVDAEPVDREAASSSADAGDKGDRGEDGAAAAEPPPPAGEARFRPWKPRTAGNKTVLDELPAAAAARTVRRVLSAGIRAEGPIHADRLVRLAAGAFGLSRVNASRKAALLSVLPPEAVVEDYLWPDGVDRNTWTSFRPQAMSGERPLEHVPPQEIGNAMAALCRAAGGTAREDLLTATAAVFGYRRRTAVITPVLEAALERALAAGRLSEQPDGRLGCP